MNHDRFHQACVPVEISQFTQLYDYLYTACETQVTLFFY